MTYKEKICLLYLADKMEASAKIIGEHLIGKNRSYSTRSAAAILGQLRARGLVTKVHDLNAWRITKQGRDSINL